MIAILSRERCNLSVILICISFKTKDIEHFFLFIGQLYFFIWELSVQFTWSFIAFCIWLFHLPCICCSSMMWHTSLVTCMLLLGNIPIYGISQRAYSVYSWFGNYKLISIKFPKVICVHAWTHTLFPLYNLIYTRLLEGQMINKQIFLKCLYQFAFQQLVYKCSNCSTFSPSASENSSI
jgi:hypothetical protein